MIELTGVTARVGGFALGPIDGAIPSHTHAVLVGPTGSGKTTLLDAIAGLRPLAGGAIRLGGVEVTRREAHQRGVGYVPQEGGLFAALSVRDNLVIGLRARGVGRAERRRRAAELADRLGVGPLLDRSPRRLSGGERRRVALGRALAFRPAVLLLDEPFAALDHATRQAMHRLLRELHAEAPFTALHVAHQQEEVEALADLVLRMDAGRLATDPVRPASRPTAEGGAQPAGWSEASSASVSKA